MYLDTSPFEYCICLLGSLWNSLIVNLNGKVALNNLPTYTSFYLKIFLKGKVKGIKTEDGEEVKVCWT